MGCGGSKPEEDTSGTNNARVSGILCVCACCLQQRDISEGNPVTKILRLVRRQTRASRLNFFCLWNMQAAVVSAPVVDAAAPAPAPSKSSKGSSSTPTKGKAKFNDVYKLGNEVSFVCNGTTFLK